MNPRQIVAVGDVFRSWYPARNGVTAEGGLFTETNPVAV